MLFDIVVTVFFYCFCVAARDRAIAIHAQRGENRLAALQTEFGQVSQRRMHPYRITCSRYTGTALDSVDEISESNYRVGPRRFDQNFSGFGDPVFQRTPINRDLPPLFWRRPATQPFNPRPVFGSASH
jgi:hypothetical protein